MHRRWLLSALAAAPLASLAACAPAGRAPTPTPPRLELRAGDDRLALDRDVKEVRVVPDPERSGRALSVELTDGARDGVARFTARHVGQHVDVVVRGRTAATVTVRDPIRGPILLTGRDDAEVDAMQRALAE